MKAALIGRKISASLTPRLHEDEARAQGFPYAYTRIDAAEGANSEMGIAQFLEFAEASGCAGVNVTYPFKIEATEHVDELSPTAKVLGSLNTVQFRHGRRIGHNTDYSGFAESFEETLRDCDRSHCILLGAGGAGSAVGLALLDGGVEHLVISDPLVAKAQSLRSKLAQLRPDKTVTATSKPEPADLQRTCGVVNATPLGMAGDSRMALDPETLPQSAWVADIVYFPLQTPLLQKAKQCGLRTMPGSGMAVYQAAHAFELITGRRPEKERMKANLAALLTKAKNSLEQQNV